MRLLPIIFLLLLTGCGRMFVEIAVLDPAYVEIVQDQAELRTQLNVSINQTRQDIDTELDSLELSHHEFYAALADDYRTEAESLKAPTDQPAKDALLFISGTLVPDFDQFVVHLYGSVAAELAQANTDLREEFNKLKAAELDAADGIKGRLAYLIRRRASIWTAFREMVAEDTNGKVQAFEESGGEPSPAVQIAKITTDSKANRIFGASLRGSPLAYAVASADEKQWKGLLNQAFGMGQLGNLNIAIKLSRNDDIFANDFTIKGLTFDPSAVATVASKVATQSLLLAAQIAGVPVNTSGTTPSGPGKALAESSNRLRQLQDANLKRAAARQDYERALLLLADVVLGEANNWRDTGKRAAAVKAISDTYTAHKPRLNLSSVQ